MIGNRNLYRITRFILLKLPFLLKFLAKFRKREKRLLIIKTDAIGDYILFRNFIEIVKRSEAFKDHEIDLLGNTLCKDIVLTYDAEFITDTFFIKPYDLYEQPLKTLKLGWRLFKRNYSLVLQPSYTRLLITDGLAALTAAKQIICFNGDTEGIKQKYKTKTDKFYTQKLLLPPNVYFEFDRSKFFFEQILKQNIDIKGPSIEGDNTIKQGIIIFTGAGIAKRSWEREKFLELIKLILQYTTQPVYLAGGPADIQTANYLTANLPPTKLIDLTGKTSLPQLVQLIGSSALVISNETSAIHIAAATNTPSVCILGGGHFGRFSPYPKNMANKPVCVYEKMECYNCNWNCIFETPEAEPYPCVGAISLEDAWLVTKEALIQL
jgi:ADP-heptose:LPS heptosyltransferase